MAENSLNLFLSASVPIEGRADGKYLKTADVIAIRDSVIALASVALPHYHLIWGGHPSITPLIANVLRHSNKEVNSSVAVYQSGFFCNEFPEENKDVEHSIVTDNLGDRKKSLDLMRSHMIESFCKTVQISLYSIKSNLTLRLQLHKLLSRLNCTYTIFAIYIIGFCFLGIILYIVSAFYI